ncbi:MAG TPA: glycosyltransferase [Nevskiaceae bacterium]|nr:glycosyltransferase [Nevskiaceae bacterium]
MTALPSVTVVMATYNYRDFLAESLDSVFAQRHAPQQLIVVDDGSTDGSGDWLRQHHGARPGLELIVRENRGQLASFVEASARARGEVIAYLDADDVWEPDYLARIGEIYAQRPEIGCVYTNLRYFGEREGLYTRDRRSRDLGLSILLGAYEPAWQATATSGMSLRRGLAQAVLDIPPALQPLGRTRADDWLNAGADILGGRKYFLAEPLARYRAHGRNVYLDRARDAIRDTQHWITVEKMLSFYRHRAGLPVEAEARLRGRAKHEFRTKRDPSFAMLRDYSRLLGRSELSWSRRLEHRLAMWRHYLRQR